MPRNMHEAKLERKIQELKDEIQKLTEERDIAKIQAKENYGLYDELIEKYKELAAIHCLSQDFSGTLH